MTVVFLGWLFSTVGQAADEPLRWRWSNPPQFGGNVFDMAYGQGLTVAVAERGQIYTSDDLDLWEPHDSGTTNSLRAVTFFGERMVIAGERGTVLWADSLEEFHGLSLGTEDWLEGVAASSNLVVAVGDNGAIYTSRWGTNWARRSTSITEWLTGVAWAQGTFVLVGERGLIATSVNGTNWTKRSSGTTRNLKRVSWMNNQFWVVGDGGLILSAPPTGMGWTAVQSGATNTVFDAAAAESDQLVAGDHEARLRRNNSMWSDVMLPPAPGEPFTVPPWVYYNTLWEEVLFMLSGRTGRMVEGFRTNGNSPYVWVERQPAVRNWIFELHRAPGFCVAVGFRGTILTSVNGIDWELELVPDTVANATLLGVSGTTNMLVAVGEGGRIIFSSGGVADLVETNLSGTIETNVVSTLGVFWNPADSPTTNTLQGVLALDGKFIVTGDWGTILTSPDGTNWTRRTTPTNNFLSGIAAFAGGFIATGQRGTLLVSADGETWEARTTGTTNWIYRVRQVGGRLMAVGQNGLILTSLDGNQWTPVNSGTTRWLNDVTWAEGRFIAVGALGAVLWSEDGVTWMSSGTITEKALYGVLAVDGRLLAAGSEGVIVRTRLVPDASPVKFLNIASGTNFNTYLLAGNPDQRFALEQSSDLANWVRGVELEFLDSTGTLLLIAPKNTNLPTLFIRAVLTPSVRVTAP